MFKVSAEGTKIKDENFYKKNNIDLKTGLTVKEVN